MRNIAIFGSGSGSNADLLMKAVAAVDDVTVKIVLSNSKEAGILERAAENGVASVALNDAKDAEEILKHLVDVDCILLLGYLKLLPEEVVEKFLGHSLNQHPALLPKYGGRGMYGRNVHEAVAASGDVQSGFTLHRVTSEFDSGGILFQKTVDLPENATADDIERLVRAAEHEFGADAIIDLLRANQI